MDSEKITRRVLLKRALYLAGLSAGPTFAAILEAPFGGRKLSSEMQNRLLTTEVDEILMYYEGASRGLSLLHYQIFFPTYLTGNELSKVDALRQKVDKRLKSPNQSREFTRVFAIPPLAAAHALVLASPSERQVLQSIASDAIENALDRDKAPNQQLLGILWRNINAVLLRNRHTWKSVEFGPSIVKVAENTCLRFLDDEPQTLILVNAAASAWQFLISYSRALLWRNDCNADIDIVNAAIARVSSVRSERSAWLVALKELYSDRWRYETMLPESYETLIGRRKYKLGTSERRAADFFVTLGLESWYLISLVAQERMKTDYLYDVDRAKTLLPDIATFFANYGIDSKEWSHLKAGTFSSFLSASTLRYLDHTFKHEPNVFQQDIRQLSERPISSLLTALVPFNQIDEYNAQRRTSRRQALLAAFVGSGNSVTKRLDLWRMTAHGVAKALARRDGVIYDKIQVDAAVDAMPAGDSRYDSAFAEHEAVISAFIKQRTVVFVPASRHPAGTGVVPAPGKRRLMTTPEGANEGCISSVSARTSVNIYLLFNFGERIAAGLPRLGSHRDSKVWITPLLIYREGDKVQEVGEMLVHAYTGKIIDPPAKEEIQGRVRSLLSD